MHGASHAGTDDDPDIAGEIAPLRREDRTDQRPRTGNRREVVAEEDQLVRGVIVDPVSQPMCRRRPLIVEDSNLGGQERAIVAVGDSERGEGTNDKPQGIHRFAPLLSGASNLGAGAKER